MKPAAASALTTPAREGFSFSQVVPATYTVVAEAPGFKKFERKDVIVGTQQSVSLDLKMEIGAVSESIQVTEEVPLIETSNASQGQVLDSQKLTDLPNLGRNPFMMSKLAQNVTPVGDPHYNRMEDQSGSSQISIAGGPVRGNNYLIDGIPITDATNRAIIIPTLEAVEEVKIQANTYDAEMARTGGGMFNTSEIGHQRLSRQPVRQPAADQLGRQQLLQQRGRHPASRQPNAPSAPASAARCASRKSTTARTRPSSGWPGKATTTRSRTPRSSPRRPRSSASAISRRARRPSGALNVIYDPEEHGLRGQHLHAAAVRRATSFPATV